jgi:anti-anti-sigma regulatory factor
VLKIQYTDNGDAVLTVSGRLQANNLWELAAAVDEERLGRVLVLDLKDLVGADEDAIRLLCACERDGIVLRNCPPYVRTWMTRERDRS